MAPGLTASLTWGAWFAALGLSLYTADDEAHVETEVWGSKLSVAMPTRESAITILSACALSFLPGDILLAMNRADTQNTMLNKLIRQASRPPPRDPERRRVDVAAATDFYTRMAPAPPTPPPPPTVEPPNDQPGPAPPSASPDRDPAGTRTAAPTPADAAARPPPAPDSAGSNAPAPDSPPVQNCAGAPAQSPPAENGAATSGRAPQERRSGAGAPASAMKGTGRDGRTGQEGKRERSVEFEEPAGPSKGTPASLERSTPGSTSVSGRLTRTLSRQATIGGRAAAALARVATVKKERFIRQSSALPRRANTVGPELADILASLPPSTSRGASRRASRRGSRHASRGPSRRNSEGGERGEKGEGRRGEEDSEDEDGLEKVLLAQIEELVRSKAEVAAENAQLHRDVEHLTELVDYLTETLQMIEHESAAVDLETPSDSDTDSGSAPYVPRRRGGEGNAEDLFRMRSVAVDPDMETPAPSDDEG